MCWHLELMVFAESSELLLLAEWVHLYLEPDTDTDTDMSTDTDKDAESAGQNG